MATTLRTDLLTSIQQCPTPLNTLFFSDFNINLVQRLIRHKFKESTDISIDYQNRPDVIALMRSVFISNSKNPDKDVCVQVKSMNEIVANMAISQINTGVSQYIGYMRDVESVHTPLAVPINTSTYGKKIEFNTQIGT